MRKLKDENQKHSRPFYEVLYGTNLTYKIDYSNDKDGPYDSCQEYFDEANLQIIPGIVQRTFLSESSEFSVIHDYFQAFHKYPYTYIQVCDRSIINLKIQHVVLEYFQSSDVANSILIRDFVLLKTKAKDAKKFRLNSTQTYDCKCDFGSFDSSDKHIDGEIIWGKWWFEGED